MPAAGAEMLPSSLIRSAWLFPQRPSVPLSDLDLLSPFNLCLGYYFDYSVIFCTNFLQFCFGGVNYREYLKVQTAVSYFKGPVD